MFGISDFAVITVNGEQREVTKGIYISEMHLISLDCGGHGKCGKCKIKATGELSDLTDTEREKLTKAEISSGIRLACQTRVVGKCMIETVDKPKTEEVLTSGKVRVVKGGASFKKLGCAVDIGTTTLAAKLVLPNSETVAECGRYNPQSVFGADVVSRIESALKGNGAELSRTVVRAIDEMLFELCTKANKSTADIDAMVITGNTAMLCLLTGISVEPLSHAPFYMPSGFGKTVKAHELGLCNLPCDTEIYFPPCISAFVGADALCAILSSGLCEKNEVGLVADIGTNGEMALWDTHTLKVCSTAAGPAFEGVGIEMGMRASFGAIDKVTVKDCGLSAHVIGDTRPTGICGSGIIDAVAALLETGKLDETGCLDEKKAEILSPVVLTAKDIRMVQLAKSAICAGILTLLNASKVNETEVKTLYVAGGFGNYLNLRSAAKIGLLPDIVAERAKVIGNAALGGALMLLCDRSLWAVAEKIAENAFTVELSSDRFFSEAYINGMMFP